MTNEVGFETSSMSTQIAYLFGSIFLFIIWLFIYFKLSSKDSRQEMIKVSLATSVLGLTEPIFVPEYWNPSTIFNLAQRTSFDIESFIFAFAVGGIAVSIYEVASRVKHQKLPIDRMHDPRHKFHLLALFAAPTSFIFLYALTSLNPIYSTILSLFIGALATFYCRPDLIKKMATSGIIFFFIYFIFFFIFNILFPGYIQKVWNLKALSGILLFGIPLEELVFATSLGLMWSSVYEHVFWYKVRS